MFSQTDIRTEGRTDRHIYTCARTHTHTQSHTHTGTRTHTPIVLVRRKRFPQMSGIVRSKGRIILTLVRAKNLGPDELNYYLLESRLMYICQTNLCMCYLFLFYLPHMICK